jgi:hypothetical protein
VDDDFMLNQALNQLNRTISNAGSLNLRVGKFGIPPDFEAMHRDIRAIRQAAEDADTLLSDYTFKQRMESSGRHDKPWTKEIENPRKWPWGKDRDDSDPFGFGTRGPFD